MTVGSQIYEGKQSMVDVGFAELHGPLFCGGKNHGVKLDTHNKAGLEMVYDKDEKELLVTWNNSTAHVPATNIVCYIPGPSKGRRIVQESSTQLASIAHAQVETPSTRKPPQTAQIETPMSHVHKGKGHGKTRQTK